MFDLMQYALIFYDFQLILAQMPIEGEASPLAEADLHIRQPSRDTRDSRGSYGGACA